MERTRTRWVVQMQDNQGQIHETDFHAFWDPSKDFITTESVAATCAAQETVKAKGQREFVGISAVAR